MEKAEIRRNINLLKLGETDRYDGPLGTVDVRKTTGGLVTITLVNCTREALVDMVVVIQPEGVCASPEDPNR